MSVDEIVKALGDDADFLLGHTCSGINKTQLALPGADFIERVLLDGDRPIPVLNNLARIFTHGRLGGSGYLSLLPADQGVEHAAGASFAHNPPYFDPAHIIELAIEGGCNAVAATLGSLAQCARRFAHKIPFVVKLNHNELLTYPTTFDQIMFASVKQAYDMGAAAVGATIYFGSPQAARQIQEVARAFEQAHQMGLATILWCYLRHPAFKQDGVDYHLSADLTGQANYLGATIKADIVHQKLPAVNGGFEALAFGHTDERIYEELSSSHPIDLARYQVANCFMGRTGLLHSGGASGKDDFRQAVRTAVINKRAGGMGLLSGRKALQRPFEEGVALLHSIQDVYCCREITIA